MTNIKALRKTNAPPTGGVDVRRPHHGPPPALITSTIVPLAVLLWLALPALVLADNWWSDGGELKKALKDNWDFNAALIGGALAAIGGALSRAGDWLGQAQGGSGESMQAGSGHGGNPVN